MAELSDLEQKIKDKLGLSEERTQLQHDHLQQQMAEAEARSGSWRRAKQRVVQYTLARYGGQCNETAKKLP
jgi:hypothetical protein